jgi:radical SAM protein with 4Fe4S-binding SPASM domain
MIDFERLNKSYKRKGFYALQLEVGDRCHQGCIYCYMNALDTPINTLSDEQIHDILSDAKKLNITAIEWLGGEPLLRSSVFDHMAYARELGMRNNMWTGGLPLKDKNILKKTAECTKYGLISFHLSTIDPQKYEELHPGHLSDEMNSILDSIRGLLNRGYPPGQMLNSVTFTGLQSVEDMIGTIDFMEDEFNIKTSLNVYHTYLRPGMSDKTLEQFIPSTEAVEKVYNRYGKQWDMDAYPMNCVNKQYCSSTLAVLCDGSVTPCATIREKDAPSIHNGQSLYQIAKENRDHLIFSKFRDSRYLPRSCKTCELTDICFGCRSRSYAAGHGIYGKDPRCFR